jgi:hypothetical protein
MTETFTEKQARLKREREAAKAQLNQIKQDVEQEVEQEGEPGEDTGKELKKKRVSKSKTDRIVKIFARLDAMEGRLDAMEITPIAEQVPANPTQENISIEELNDFVRWVRNPELCDIDNYRDIALATINRVRKSGKRQDGNKPYEGGQFVRQPVLLFAEYRNWKRLHSDM